MDADFTADMTPQGRTQQVLDELLAASGAGCQCLTRLMQQTMATLHARHEGEAFISTGDFDTVGIQVVGNRLVTAPFHRFRYGYQKLLPDGGLGRFQAREVDLLHTYCSFCGALLPTA